MRILAGMLCLCVLVTTCPDMPGAVSASAAEERTETGERYISGFAELPEDDGAPGGEVDDGENGGKEDGSATGGDMDDGENGGKEDGGASDGETGDGEAGGGEDDGKHTDGGAGILRKKEKEETAAEEQQEPQKKEQEETQEETLTVSGITWQSAPVYDGNTEGIYTFTAVLPDGYAPAEGVSLPEIRVIVEQVVAKPRRAERAAAASDWGGTGVRELLTNALNNVFAYGNNLTITQGSTEDTTKFYYTGSSTSIELSPAEGSVADGFHMEQYSLCSTGGDYDCSSYDSVIHMSGGILKEITTTRSNGGNIRSVQFVMSGGTLLSAFAAHMADISGDSVIKGKLFIVDSLSVSGLP